MSTPSILRRLYSLDTSSPDSLRYLYCLIRHDEMEQYLPNLREPELARLVDFLDEVRTLPSAFCQLRNELRRLSTPFPLTAIFLENAYTNYKPSVAAARSYHPHVSYLMGLPGWVVVRLPLEPLSIYGKALIATKKCPSSV